MGREPTHARVVDEVEPAARRRRWWPGLTAAAVFAAVVVGVGALFTQGFSTYRTGGCKWYAVAPILAELPGDERQPPARSAGEAVARYARAIGNPLPADGWHEYRGRWVRDLPDGTYAEVEAIEREGGWVAHGYSICRH